MIVRMHEKKKRENERGIERKRGGKCNRIGRGREKNKEEKKEN